MNSDSGLTSDMSLSEQVEQALQSDAATAGHPLSVAAQGATITLTGEVDSQETKDAAIRAARSVSGVVDVIDDVTVGHGDGGGFLGLGRNDDDAGGGDDTAPTIGALGALGLAGRAGATGSGQGLGLGAAGAPLIAGGLAGAERRDADDSVGDDNRDPEGKNVTSMDDWEG